MTQATDYKSVAEKRRVPAANLAHTAPAPRREGLTENAQPFSIGAHACMGDAPWVVRAAAHTIGPASPTSMGRPNTNCRTQHITGMQASVCRAHCDKTRRSDARRTVYPLNMA